MSEINLPFSPITLFFTKGAYFEEIKARKTVFNLFKIALDKKEIGLPFLCIVYSGLFSQ